MRTGRRNKVRLMRWVEWSTTTMSLFTKPNNMCVTVGVWLSSERLRERERGQNDGMWAYKAKKTKQT